eukprot:754612-Pleurochrysis_carterae.AAC.4
MASGTARFWNKLLIQSEPRLSLSRETRSFAGRGRRQSGLESKKARPGPQARAHTQFAATCTPRRRRSRDTDASAARATQRAASSRGARHATQLSPSPDCHPTSTSQSPRFTQTNAAPEYARASFGAFP